MAEYIEREAAIKLFNFAVLDCLGMEPTIRAWDIIKALESIPAADVRPVVTCADCKYNTREVNDLFGNNAIQCITGLTHRRDWFCADGEKREES